MLKKEESRKQKDQSKCFVAYYAFSSNMLGTAITESYKCIKLISKLSLANIHLHLFLKRSLIMGLSTVSICLMFNSSYAQAITPVPQTFIVGEKLPESFWAQEYDIYQGGKTSKQNLARYKNKILLLDFWASWCTTCMKKWPLLDSVQQYNAEHLNILLINEKRNRDDLDKVKLRMDAKTKAGEPIRLASVYLDTSLYVNFPHHLLPHYIWISEKGIVEAITGTEFITAETIKLMVNKRQKRLTKIKNQ